ncbi:MAG: cytochrome c biogenesis protein [Candidatus Poribacteria bacterium]|nr:cytochrome c biogenesis protein [Candidatus Poribacteria bacterium]
MKNASFTPFVGFLGAGGLFWAIYLVFGYAVVEETMLEVQKIFYFHVSSAFVAFTAYAFTCVCSIIYLIRKNDKFDALASASAELGLVFCTVVLVTGPIWARSAWGTWWNWEARLTSSLILWLMYIGYFILRAMLDVDLRKTYSSVLGVVAFLNVPIVYYSVEIWQDRLHPPTNTKSQLPPSMTEAWLVSWLALTLLYVFLLILRTQSIQMKSRIDALHFDQVNS